MARLARTLTDAESIAKGWNGERDFIASWWPEPVAGFQTAEKILKQMRLSPHYIADDDTSYLRIMPDNRPPDRRGDSLEECDVWIVPRGLGDEGQKALMKEMFLLWFDLGKLRIPLGWGELPPGAPEKSKGLLRGFGFPERTHPSKDGWHLWEFDFVLHRPGIVALR